MCANFFFSTRGVLLPSGFSLLDLERRTRRFWRTRPLLPTLRVTPPLEDNIGDVEELPLLLVVVVVVVVVIVVASASAAADDAVPAVVDGATPDSLDGARERCLRRGVVAPESLIDLFCLMRCVLRIDRTLPLVCSG